MSSCAVRQGRGSARARPTTANVKGLCIDDRLALMNGLLDDWKEAGVEGERDLEAHQDTPKSRSHTLEAVGTKHQACNIEHRPFCRALLFESSINLFI